MANNRELSQFGSFVEVSGSNVGITTNLNITGIVTATNLSVTNNTIVGGALTVTGNLTVNGTTTIINSTTISVDDKNIELGTVDTPSDTTADGGGIILKGGSDHTIIWSNANDSWDFSEHVNIVTGKEYKINNVSVLSSTGLGSSIVNSSLTSFGTVPTATINNLTNTNINSSGIVTAGTFNGNLQNTLTLNTSGVGLTGSTTFNNSGAATFTVTSNATSANTGSAIVARDSGGNFYAGIITATLSGNASSATALANARTFAITGDIVGSPVSFDGTGNVSIAATIQPNSVALGDDTSGNYVATISGTANRIEVSGSGSESAAVTINLPNIISITGVNATGVITATTFSGSGASLTSIPNGALVNSTVSYGGVTLSLGGSNATPAFNLVNATGLPVSTGITGLGANVATFLATPSSENLRSAVTDETGSGSLVFATSPTLVSPTLGSASATSVNISGITTSNAFDVGIDVGISTARTTVATTSPTAIESFSASTYRSARMQVQITQGTDYQASDILIIHNGTTANLIEYGSVATGSYLGDFTADINSGNARLLVSMVTSTSATVKVLTQKIKV